jgi:uncharacterized membrane protein YesL
MNGFFRFDGKFYKYGTLIADVMILTILWLLTSLPIITIGASTTALYYVTTRQLSNREGYITKDYFKSFKQNFFKATGVELLFAVIIGVLTFNINYLSASSPFYFAQFVMLALALAVLSFVFPVLARFELTFFELISKSFFLAIRHFLTSVTCLALMFAIYWLLMDYPIFVILCPGVYAIITSLMFMRVFRKYLPEMDTEAYDEKKYHEMYAAEEAEAQAEETQAEEN